MISIKSNREIELMKHAGYINYLTHREVEKSIKVGITTKELNDIAHNFIIKSECIPSFLNYEGYPASICTSINEEVVHGIPSNRKLKKWRYHWHRYWSLLSRLSRRLSMVIHCRQCLTRKSVFIRTYRKSFI